MSIDRVDLGSHFPRAFVPRVGRDFAVHVEAANVDLLVVEIQGVTYALRIAELATVQRTGNVEPFTHGGFACAGVTDVNGRVVVVHDLAILLGYTGPEDQSFVAVSRFDQHVGIVMPPVSAYVRVPGHMVTRHVRPGIDARVARIEHEGRELVLLDVERLLHTH